MSLFYHGDRRGRRDLSYVKKAILRIFSVCSVNSVLNDTLINLKPIGQVSAAVFDMTGNLPDVSHNLFNIQLKNLTILYQDTTVHHDIAHV